MHGPSIAWNHSRGTLTDLKIYTNDVWARIQIEFYSILVQIPEGILVISQTIINIFVI